MSGRFVVLEHDHPFLHWDLLLENGPAAATWRLLALPAHGASVKAERLTDHRLLYLDYEGPVSGNRGTVRRIDSGTWHGQIASSQVQVRLVGTHLCCTAGWTEERGDAGSWTFDERSPP